LKKEPAARLFDEMLKLLMSGQSYACLKKLRDEGLSRGVLPLLDAVLDDEGDDRFLKLALASTDSRIREDKPISVGFLLATLLWRQVNQRWQTHLSAGERSVAALMQAIGDVESEQDESLAIPRRFGVTMREIWMLQSRFEQRVGQRPYRFLEQPRFRAAFDFLALRAEAGEASPRLVAWWSEFQQGNEIDREALLAEARETEIVGDGGVARKRRRRRRRPGGAAQEEA